MALHPLPATFVINTIYPNPHDPFGMDWDAHIVADLPGCDGKVIRQELPDGEVFFGAALLLGKAGAEPFDGPIFRQRERVMAEELALWRLRHGV